MKKLIVFLVAGVTLIVFGIPLKQLEVPPGTTDGQVLTYFGPANAWYPKNAGGGGSDPWTNNTNFIWPAGEPAPSLTVRGPSVAFFSNGSVIVGTNALLDLGGNPTSIYYPYAWSLTASNDPPSLNFTFGGADSESYNNFSGINGSAFVDKDAPYAYFSADATGTNGTHHKLHMYADPSGNVSGGSHISISTNNNSSFVFYADHNGTVTANEYLGSNYIAVATNYVAGNFAAIPGVGFLVMSNNALYFVTKTKTTLLATP